MSNLIRRGGDTGPLTSCYVYLEIIVIYVVAYHF